MKSQKILFENMFEINNFLWFRVVWLNKYFEQKENRKNVKNTENGMENPFESFSQLDFVCSAISQKYKAPKVHTYLSRSLLKYTYINANNNPRFSHMQILCKYS